MVAKKVSCPPVLLKKKVSFSFGGMIATNKEALAIYERYELLQDDEGGIITVPDFTTDDAQKAAHYYFCEKDIAQYKRVITNIGVGCHDPPNLNCK